MRKQILILVLLAGALAGCHSTRSAPPCEPEIVPKPYPVPVYVGVVIPPLSPMDLPPYPTPPPAGASEEDLKEYAHGVRIVTQERAELRDARIEALGLQIEANNDYAVAHPAPTPPPE